MRNQMLTGILPTVDAPPMSPDCATRTTVSGAPDFNVGDLFSEIKKRVLEAVEDAREHLSTLDDPVAIELEIDLLEAEIERAFLRALMDLSF